MLSWRYESPLLCIDGKINTEARKRKKTEDGIKGQKQGFTEKCNQQSEEVKILNLHIRGKVSVLIL